MDCIAPAHTHVPAICLLCLGSWPAKNGYPALIHFDIEIQSQ
jgi:hypothetical protein